MIRLLKYGDYALAETTTSTRILTLSGKGEYIWINAKGIGEILIASPKKHPANYILALGKYRLYEVKDEEKLTDTIHLELLIGRGIWQGYLLITGLPSSEHKKSRILPTKEIITRSNAHLFRPHSTHPPALSSHL